MNKNLDMTVLQTVICSRAEACPPPCVTTTNKLRAFGHCCGKKFDRPDARELINGLVTRFIEAQVYHAVIENHACEQAAKMLAMKNATENADQLIDSLTLLYNNVRQAAITREISEIVGGAAAV